MPTLIEGEGTQPGAHEQLPPAQTITRQVDIPDTALKETPKIKLAPEIAEERHLRRYIRPDGVIVKNVHCMFIDTIGYDKKQRPILKARYTPEEAEAVVIEIAEKAGRAIETDVISGRKKAVPGWSLDIRVPGMESSERKAPMKPVGEDRQKINEALIASQQATIDSLTERMDALTEQLAGSKEEKAAEQKGKSAKDSKK